HGQSLSSIDEFSVHSFADDLNLILKNIGIEETILVGWSLGGMISIEYFLQHPQRTKALILISMRTQRQPIWKRKIWVAYLRARLNLMMNLSAPRKFNLPEATFPDEKLHREEEIKKMFSTTISPEIDAWIKDDLKNFSFHNFWQIAKNLWDWEISDEKLAKIHIPALILVGEKDQITPPSLAHSLQQAIPHSQLLIIKEAGHLLPIEQPQIVNSHIAEFLKSINY
ncbi:MAG: alpha/beta fold hydrolase, partial [Thermodesulfobacteriota bacterium]